MSVVLEKGPAEAAECAVEREVSAVRELYVARAELVLSGPDHRPLGELSLKPDPLQLVAAALSHVRSELGEDAEVVVDLVPVPAERVGRRRRRLVRRAQRRGPTAYGDALGGGSAGGWSGSVWGDVVEGLNGGRPAGSSRSAARPSTKAPRQRDLAEGVGKFVPGAGVFAVQVMVRTVATHPARARARLHQLLAALSAGQGENRWRPVGPRRGPWRPYSNVWWRRRGFDRRWSSAEFAPARRWQWVTTREIAAWMKPPTVHCRAENVRRLGGVLPPAPATLPTWTGQQGMVPLGLVSGTEGARRLVAVPQADVLFSAIYGRSGFGKSELALLIFLTVAYSGYGAMFLDPHGSALERARPYLAHPAIQDRLWDVDLSRGRVGDMAASWNPLSMEGRGLDDVHVVVGSIVGSIVASQGWGDSAPRAVTIVSHAVYALVRFAWRMCQDGRPELQPTIFQVSTLLLDENWRQTVLAQLPAKQRRWWTAVFPSYSSDAVPVVTRLMDQLELSPSAQGFLGAPRSTYSAREAMDSSRVVLLRPTGTGGADKLITSMVLFDLFLAGLSREGIQQSQLATMFAFVDELTAVDGAGRGTIAAILEQLRKYEVRFGAMTQMAMRLTPETRAALMQNQSLLVASGADVDEAGFIAKRLPGLTPETLVMLPKYQYVASTMLHGQRTSPFRVQGVAVDQVLADYYNPAGLAEQRAAVDRNLRRRPIGDIVTDLEELDQKILTHLAGGQDQSTTDNSRPTSGVVHQYRDEHELEPEEESGH